MTISVLSVISYHASFLFAREERKIFFSAGVRLQSWSMQRSTASAAQRVSYNSPSYSALRSLHGTRAPRRNCASFIENVLFSKSEQKRLFFFASPHENYLFQEEIQKKILFQGQFAKNRVSFSRIMAEIPNRGVKSIKKISDIDRKQKKDNFIFYPL